ncbi:MAG: ECF transporter S component [Eubacteriales bacterium]|nr:ECF transporter S component [Eubacteriales bacterium]
MSTQTAAKTTNTNSKVKMIAQIGMLGAIAVVLMLFEVPLPFAPSFYEIDFSEVPVLLGCFVMGPVAGVAIEFIKILLNFVINGTVTAGVGELANFILGVSFVVPAGMIYRKNHTRKGAIIGMLVGTVLMTFAGCFLNAYVLLPAYGKAFGMPIEALVSMGTAVNANITSLFTFIAFAVAPFNILKGVLDSIIVFLIYKKVRPIFSM